MILFQVVGVEDGAIMVEYTTYEECENFLAGVFKPQDMYIRKVFKQG